MSLTAALLSLSFLGACCCHPLWGFREAIRPCMQTISEGTQSHLHGETQMTKHFPGSEQAEA